MPIINQILIFLSLVSFNLLNAQVDTLHWRKLATFPGLLRGDANHFLIDSNFFIIGGRDENSVLLSDVWKYDITANQWQQMANFPGGYTSGSASFTYSGFGYICTGIDSSIGGSCGNFLWQYNPTSDSWIRQSNFPGLNRFGANGFTNGNKGYLICGGSCSVGLNDCWVIDFSTAQWTYLDTIPAVGRIGGNVAITDSCAYLLGGFNTDVLSDFWEYNFRSSKWLRLADIPCLVGRSSPLIWSSNGNVIAGYGITENQLGSYTLGKDIYRYNFSQNKWDTIFSFGFLSSVAEGASFCLGNKCYFFGGYKQLQPTSKFYGDLWCFDISDINHTSVLEDITDDRFRIYPSLLISGKNLNTESELDGEISFYNILGESIYQSHIHSGTNVIQSTDIRSSSDVLFYLVKFRDGTNTKGRIIVVN